MRALLFALLVLASSFETFAQQRFAQSPGSDGERIESALKSVVDSCFGDYAKYSPNFLPDTFREPRYRTLLSRKVDNNRIIEGVKFELLARSVFANTSDLSAQISGNVGRSSPIDVTLPDAVPLNDANSVVFAFTCTTALKLALEQDFTFGYSLPGTASAGIKQGLQVQSDTSKKTSLAMMYGIFRSPLSIALNSTDLALKSHASSSVWSYYMTEDGQKQLTGDPKYLRSVKGWLLSRVSSRDLASMVTASTSASGGIFGFEANLGGSARISFGSSFSSSDFTIILDDAIVEGRDLVPIPKPTDLSTNIGKAALHFPQDIVPFLKGKPIRLNSKLRGVPAWLCNSNWSVRTTPATDTSAVYANFNQSTLQCDIYLDSTVATDIQTLDVTLRNESFPLVVGGSKGQYLELSHSYTLRAQAEPVPIPSADPIVTFQSDQANPTFSVSIAFDIMPSDPIALVYVKRPPFISCETPGVAPNLYPSSKPLSPANTQYAANMSVTFPADGFIQADCKVTVPVTLRYKDSGTEVDRELRPVQVHFARPARVQ